MMEVTSTHANGHIAKALSADGAISIYVSADSLQITETATGRDIYQMRYSGTSVTVDAATQTTINALLDEIKAANRTTDQIAGDANRAANAAMDAKDSRTGRAWAISRRDDI